MSLGLSDSLPALVEAKYKSAKAASSIIYSATELAVIRTKSGLPFQLRFCPTLVQKPQKQEKKSSKGAKRFNPFENPPKEQLIAEIPKSNPTHLLVLNKFPIISEHFILATKSFKEQADPLQENDVEITYQCLKAWEAGNSAAVQRKLFAFFNSGKHSGASQSHRHVQFLPVEKMRQGDEKREWNLLLQILTDGIEDSDTRAGMLPFTYFLKMIPERVSSSTLHGIYNELYESTFQAYSNFVGESPNASGKDHGERLPDFSYNMGMTTSAMIMCPRVAEGEYIRNHDDSEAGFVALNGTLLGGTLMVKRAEEWEYLKENPLILSDILASIGVPSEILDSTLSTTKI